jgi:hypothetical protein
MIAWKISRRTSSSVINLSPHGLPLQALEWTEGALARSYWQRAKVAPLVDENPYLAVMMGGASQSAGSSPAAVMSLCAAGAAPAFCRASAS